MSTPGYLAVGLVLSPSAPFSALVEELQRDLRCLGYGTGPFDGIYGPATTQAVEALQFDLLNNNGASSAADGNAPVSVQSYNNGRVTSVTGVVDQGTAASMAAMLADTAFPKLPSSANPASDNLAALTAIGQLQSPPVPLPFLMAILQQESGCRHYHVPAAGDTDSYVTTGMVRNDPAHPFAITSRGFGIGQYTLFHHPPTAGEVAGVIADPVRNVSQTVSQLSDKFNHYVNGATPDTQAADRIAEAGAGPLRTCRYPAGDPRNMSDCAQCMSAAGEINIVAGVTPFYAGCAETYAATQYHKGSYNNVPVRANLLCDWAYAVRRYNGSGVNSYDYQAEVLQRMAGAGGGQG